MLGNTINEDRVRLYENVFPITGWGRAEEDAELVAFLASERVAYITRPSLDINDCDLAI